MIKLAQGFLSNRDFSSARLLLRRAAEAASAAAALSLGETFDPLVIQQLHTIGVQPDPAKTQAAHTLICSFSTTSLTAERLSIRSLNAA